MMGLACVVWRNAQAGGQPMWWTPDGMRVMYGPELKLFSEAADALRSRIVKSRRRNRTGVRFFDQNLEPDEQLVAIQFAVDHLSDPDAECPNLTAWVEATIYAVFKTALSEIRREIRTKKPNYAWRGLAFDAYMACYGHEIGKDMRNSMVRNARSRSVDSWSWVIDLLSQCILWDRDWELDETFMDLPPESSRHLKMLAGIDDDYFVEVPPACGR
jgi:hypothetical protein